MKQIKILFIPLLLIAFSCKKDVNEDKYSPTDVIVKIKQDYSTSEIFDLINSYDHEVEYISSLVFQSSLPPDSLQYVIDYLNSKSYTNNTNWSVTGYLHNSTNKIKIFPRLFDINNQTNQSDWLTAEQLMEFSSPENGAVIMFHVPEGEEQSWVLKFRSNAMVEWAELNYFSNIEKN